MVLVGGAVFGLLAIAGVWLYIAHGPPTNAVDADYFAILEVSYETVAAAEYARFWHEEGEKFAYFKDEARSGRSTAATEARTLAGRVCLDAAKGYDEQKLERRRLFVQRHGMDHTQHRAAFTKRYPDRDLIFAEIGELTKKHARVRMSPLVTKLGNEHGRLIAAFQPLTEVRLGQLDAEFDKFRSDLLRKEVPIVLKELQDMVRAMPAVKKMGAAVK
jgi:hypothetical protein